MMHPESVGSLGQSPLLSLALNDHNTVIKIWVMITVGSRTRVKEDYYCCPTRIMLVKSPPWS